MRPSIAVDGAIHEIIHQYVLMRTVGFDANEHSVILAWGFAMTESEEKWEWFLRRLRTAVPHRHARLCHHIRPAKSRSPSPLKIFSCRLTRAKGLTIAIQSTFRRSYECFCVLHQHDRENVKVNFPQTVRLTSELTSARWRTRRLPMTTQHYYAPSEKSSKKILTRICPSSSQPASPALLSGPLDMDTSAAIPSGP